MTSEDVRATVLGTLTRNRVGERVSAQPEPYRERIAELIADALNASAVSSPPTITEPTRIALAARQGGRTQRTIEAMLDRANERGIAVEIVPPQITPLRIRRLREAIAAQLGQYPTLDQAETILTAALHPGGETNG